MLTSTDQCSRQYERSRARHFVYRLFSNKFVCGPFIETVSKSQSMRRRYAGRSRVNAFLTLRITHLYDAALPAFCETMHANVVLFFFFFCHFNDMRFLLTPSRPSRTLCRRVPFRVVSVFIRARARASRESTSFS